MVNCSNCGTVGSPTAAGTCVACGRQVARPPAHEPANDRAVVPSASPPPYKPRAALPPPPVGVPPAGSAAHCPQCGNTLGGADRFCAICGNPRANATAAPATLAPTYASAPSPAPPSEHPSNLRRTLMIAAGVLSALLVVIVAAFALQRSSSSSDEATPPPSSAPPTTTLAGRTDELASQLTARLCPGKSCVDASTPGVITVDTKPGGEYGTDLLNADELDGIAQDLHVWSVADARRMLETRALDGTLASTNGAVTWTYHPDSGLDIVIDVESLPSAD